MRLYEGRQYWNCDGFTEEEMKVIAHWTVASNQEKQAMRKNHGWNGTESSLFKEDSA